MDRLLPRVPGDDARPVHPPLDAGRQEQHPGAGHERRAHPPVQACPGGKGLRGELRADLPDRHRAAHGGTHPGTGTASLRRASRERTEDGTSRPADEGECHERHRHKPAGSLVGIQLFLVPEALQGLQRHVSGEVLPGAEIKTFFAPASKCFLASSYFVNLPVHSKTISISFQGRLFGSISLYIFIFSISVASRVVSSPTRSNKYFILSFDML